MPITAARVRYTIIAFLAAMVLLHAVFFWHARHLIAQRYPDFTAFYAAGLMVRSGMGHQLYDLNLQSQIEREKLGRPSTIPPLPFLRPPYEALAFVPFSTLPYLAAFSAWNVFTVGLLLAWIGKVRNELGALREISPAFWLLALLGFFPLFLNVPLGQDSIPFLLLVTLAFFKFRNNREFSAGVWLGFAAFKPQIVFPLLLILLFGPQRTKLLWGFLVASFAVLLISVGVSGWNNVLHYPQYLLQVNRELGNGTITPSDMPNLRGLATMLGAQGSNQVVVIGASLLMILFVGSTWLKTLWGNLDLDSAFSISIVVALMVSYHTHVYDLALLILPIALRLDSLLKEPDFRRHAAALGVIALLFLSPFYLVLIRQGFANLIALPVLFFAISIGVSGVIKTRASISPSIGI